MKLLQELNLIENSNKRVHITIVHAVRYNGVYATVDWNSAPEGFDVNDEIEKVFEYIADHFVDLLEDDFSDSEEERNEVIINKATELLRPLIPNVVVHFQEDHYSS